MKVGNPKNGESKVAVEEKVKAKLTEMGGMEIECKVKNSGDLSYEYESNCLQVSRVIGLIYYV